MKEIIRADLYRYGGQTNILKGIRIAGFRYMYFFRKASQYKKKSVLGIYYRFIMLRLGYKYGFQIPATTSIGEGFYIGHFGCVVINRNAKIGKNCNIHHSTTIGEVNIGRLKGNPIIGNEVWIGAGSVIVGNIKIGNNVFIAPNSFVYIDVPDNSMVIGNPAKIIQRENPTEGYINHILN